MEMDTGSSIHSKSMVHDDGSGSGAYGTVNSPGSSFMNTSIPSNSSSGKMNHNISMSEVNPGSIEDASSSRNSDSMVQPEDDDNVNKYVNVQGGSDQQSATDSTKQDSRSLRSRASSKLRSQIDNDVTSQAFIDSLHDPNGFAIDPTLGSRASPAEDDHSTMSPTSTNHLSYQKNQNGYDRSQEQSNDVAAAQAEFYHQHQSQIQQTNHAAQLQLQAQVRLQQQRQLQQLQSQATPDRVHHRSLQHQSQIQQQQAYLSKQSNQIHHHPSYNVQHPHQLPQSISATEEAELFVRNMSPSQTPENGSTRQTRSMRHDAQQDTNASPYAGIEMIANTSPYNSNSLSAGHLANQLTQFGDSMDVAAAAMGMDFGNIRHSAPIPTTPMAMIPPPPPRSNGGTPGPRGFIRKRKASFMGSGDSESIAELKHMANSSMADSLIDLALRVREEENGSSAEKFRQTFAMAWLQKNCELSPDAAVPRNRIYARYVELCAEYSLKPLNPASFGKLVRVAYPGIKTRRLGVRGQSKYHYCGFRLIGEQNNPTGTTPTGTPGRFGNSPDSMNLKNQMGYENNQFGSGYPPQSPHSTPSQVRLSRSSSTLSEFDSKLTRTGLEEFAQVGSTGSDMGTGPDLRFQTSFSDFPGISLSSTAHESFSIPRLDKFLKSNIDPDCATTLYSLYLSHCRSLVESLRFMHIKKFLNFMGAFVGGLTAPIRKLLCQEGVAMWILQADWAMYKEMVQMLSPLALQEVPAQVISGLKSLSQFLPQHLTNTLSNFELMLQAKLKPAQAFCNLLDRLIRANEAGQNAGKILVDPIETRKMRDDWTRFIDPKAIVMREIPCGGADAQKILSEDVVQLLSMGDYGEEFDMDIKSEYVSKASGGDSTFNNDSEFIEHQNATETNNDNNDSNDGNELNDNIAFSKSEVVVLKWAQYLSALPWRFPHVPARLFLLCMSGLLTASLREISMNGGEGFGAWWVVRCWIDEWMGWSAEMGGFLAMKVEGEPARHDTSTQQQQEQKQQEPQEKDQNQVGSGNGIGSGNPISNAINNGKNSSSSADIRRDNFGEDLVLEGDGLRDRASTENLLTCQGSTKLVFPGQGGRRNSGESGKKIGGTPGDVNDGDKNNNKDKEYEFITDAVTAEEEDGVGAVAELDTGTGGNTKPMELGQMPTTTSTNSTIDTDNEKLNQTKEEEDDDNNKEGYAPKDDGEQDDGSDELRSGGGSDQVQGKSQKLMPPEDRISSSSPPSSSSRFADENVLDASAVPDISSFTPADLDDVVLSGHEAEEEEDGNETNKSAITKKMVPSTVDPDNDRKNSNNRSQN